MATDYDCPAQQTVDRHVSTVGNSLGIIIGLIVVLAIGALVFFTFFDRTPTGPTVVKSPSVTKTAPPANTATPTPTTK